MRLEEQIQRVADEIEVRNVLTRIAQLADDGSLDEYMSLYTEDSVWDAGAALGVKRGHAEILAGAKERRASGTAGPGTHKRHVLTTTSVRIAGSTASARSYFLFYVDCDKAPVVAIAGVYQDELQRTPTGWKLARRKVEPA
jgi:3-phenylpropionate/cinnamic acid dioxygenase small subunit